jgi:hypothetical protein
MVENETMNFDVSLREFMYVKYLIYFSPVLVLHSAEKSIGRFFLKSLYRDIEIHILWCVYFSPNALASHTTHQRAP